MGRSVSYLNNAEFVLYFPTPEGYEEDGSYDEDMAQMNWDDMMDNLKAEIKKRLPSYYDCKEWDSNEVSIFLKNNLCNIGISEYCGLVSLSVAIRNGDYYSPDNDRYHEQFASHHASQIEPILQKIIDDLGLTRINKIATASNGEAFFERAKV